MTKEELLKHNKEIRDKKEAEALQKQEALKRQESLKKKSKKSKKTEAIDLEEKAEQPVIKKFLVTAEEEQKILESNE